MRQRIDLVLVMAASLILICATLVFSQESAISEETAMPSETQTEPETMWLWGEVISADIQKNELLVKYLEYETDLEKEITITVDDKTTYENIKSLTDIKPNDTVSIDYIVNPEGKNIAKNISLEKPEAIETPSTETTPKDVEPPLTTEY